jgi:hypothetical protein
MAARVLCVSLVNGKGLYADMRRLGKVSFGRRKCQDAKPEQVKNPFQQAGAVAQMIECLPSKSKAWSPNFSYHFLPQRKPGPYLNENTLLLKMPAIIYALGRNGTDRLA